MEKGKLVFLIDTNKTNPYKILSDLLELLSSEKHSWLFRQDDDIVSVILRIKNDMIDNILKFLAEKDGILSVAIKEEPDDEYTSINLKEII